MRHRSFSRGMVQGLSRRARPANNVREPQPMEMRNAFVILKEPGYADWPPFDNGPTKGRITHISRKAPTKRGPLRNQPPLR
jgi:hypothetical protein